MKKDVKQKLEEKLGKKVLINEPLAPYTTFKIGGPADFFFEAQTKEELIKAVEAARKVETSYFILGGGSNILIGDKGFRGLVVKNRSKNIRIIGFGGKIKGGIGVRKALVEVDSGLPFNRLVRFTIEEGLAGFEEFLGLPGTVGGAIIGNAHWQDRKIRDSIVSQKTFGREVLISAVFGLKKEGKETLWKRAKEAVIYRQKTQPKDASAGCIFKNIKKSDALRLGTPNFTTSAGFLIEAVGLKGIKIGDAQISPVHANFIINRGLAMALDVIKLIEIVKTEVKKKFGVTLEEEIVRVGDF